MKKIQVHQVDAFTNKIFGGNPAGVVFDADHLTDEEMKNIAREMNLSETAFVMKPTKKDADLKLRYFTCGKDEVAFCGHATIGSLYEIGRLGLFGAKKIGAYDLQVETNIGILPMKILKRSATNLVVQFGAPEVRFETYDDNHKRFAKRLGIPFEAIDIRYPILIEKNLNDIHFAIKSLKALGSLQFNFQHIEDNFKDEGIVVFSLLTPETFEKKSDIHVRGLAPLVGIPEDPFTGRLQGGIATYVFANKLVPHTKKVIRTEQGHFIGRPGFATIERSAHESFTIAATAVHVFSAEISL